MKLRLALLLAVALLLAGHALAYVGEDDGFTGTVEIPECDSMAILTSPAFRRAAKSVTTDTGEEVQGLTIVDVYSNKAYFTEDTRLTTMVTGGSGNYSFKYYLYTLYDPEEQDIPTNQNLHTFVESKSNVFSYRMVVPGHYYFRVEVTDEKATVNGVHLSQKKRYSLTVEPKEGYTETAEDRAEAIVAECLETCWTDYEKALWLHDWITHHAHYSRGDTEYYSEDGVLFRGDGVCDSYTKAYRLLLNKAGLECDRIVNSARNHSWNRARLDGAWYQIDLTWDDPGNAVVPVSRKERHLYFCLSDTLMQVNHNYVEDAEKPCVSLTMNYYVHDGYAAQWVAELKGSAMDGLESGSGRETEISLNEDRLKGYEALSSSSFAYISTAVTAWVLEQESHLPELAYLGEERVWMDYWVTSTSDTTFAVLHASAIQLMSLPDMLGEIGPSAFEGNGALQAVALSENIHAIGDRAFANCNNLRMILIPPEIEADSISESAFVGCVNLTFYCEAGSGGADYAKGAGFECYTWPAE